MSGVTGGTCKLREFGMMEGIPQLTDPSLIDDEHLGWGLTAVTARLLQAKGAYRCPDGKTGFLYVTYTDLHPVEDGDASASKSKHTKQIQCERHGAGQATYVCEHLFDDPEQEWFSDEPSPSNPWPDAWCATCDEAYQEQGEWNDNNSDHIKIKTSLPSLL
jgi:hypothetical protein